MAMLEITYGHCSTCGHGLLVQVWWPLVTVIKRLVDLGGLAGLDGDDLAALFDAAQEVDEFEQDDNGGLANWLAGAGIVGLFVDGSREQAIKCPECGGLLGILARQRVG